MRRTSLFVAGALLAGTALSTSAFADRPARLADGPLADADDVAWMLDLERKLDEDNFVYGKAVAAYWPDTQRLPGASTATGGWGDSGLWNGVYLGGQSYRYATATAHLDALPGKGKGNGHEDDRDKDDEGERDGVDDERDFWTEQRDNALAKITESLRTEHVDINIAEDWQGTLKVPAVNPNGYPLGGDRHLADFGGGVVEGQKGMIMRACTPAGATAPTAIGDPTVDAAQPVNNNSNRVFQIRWASGDGVLYNCEASPSRDTYAGLTFGLLTAYDLVGPDFPALRKQIRADLQAMGDFLIKYGWSYPRPHGYVSAKHDFDGFVSPLFVQVPLARLNLTNAVRHVLADGDDPVAKATWDGIWAEELASQGALLPGSMEVDSLQPNDGYYKFNLHHLTAFNLLRTTTGAEHDLIARSFAITDKTTRDDLNAHFQTLMYGVTGETSRRDEAITYLRQWKQYRTNTGDGQVIRNSARCGTELACVPQDQYEIATPTGDVTWFPGEAAVTGGTPEMRAARPMPVANRAPSDFIWQRPATQLDGQEAPNGREPGIDYLTPYWMLRYFTEVQTPALSPLPEWTGPAHY